MNTSTRGWINGMIGVRRKDKVQMKRPPLNEWWGGRTFSFTILRTTRFL